MEDNVLPANEDGFYKNQKGKWFSDRKYSDFIGVKEVDNMYPSNIAKNIDDRIITLSFKAAIEINSEKFRNKIVLDINSGIGLNSLLAAQCGAKKVYSVEPNTTLSFFARKVVENNYYKNIIHVINKDIYNVKIKEKVDIIICNWMGFFLMQCSNIKRVLYARDKFLAKDGIILPDKATIYVAGIEDIEYKTQKLTMWDDAYGINMSCMKNETLNAPLIDNFNCEKIISTICPVYMINMYTVNESDLNFSSKYDLVFTRDDNFSAIAAWFDVEISKMPNTIKFTTSPFNVITNYKQTIFYIKDDIIVKKGDKLRGSLCSRVNNKMKEMNGLDVKISYHFERKGCDKEKEVNCVKLYKIAI